MSYFKKGYKPYLAILAMFFFLLTGCEIEPNSPNDLSDADSFSAKLPQLPEGFESRANPILNLGSENAREKALALTTDPQFREMVRRAVEETECDSNTDLSLWLDGELADWDLNMLFFAIFSGMLDFPTYDALLFENSSEGQYFGINGEYTKQVTKAFKDLKRFWNIESSDIVLAAMHGNMLLDREKVIRVDKILYGDDQATAEYWADLFLEYLDFYPAYRNGDHPIFTFNAFAVNSFPFGTLNIPDKIIMGDGVMDGYAALGFGDVAPQAILAHEFGHHIQYQLDLFGPDTPEATRRTELMADAYSAYYLSHARGATMQWKRVEQFLEVFFNIGDCGFTSSGHHGTPLQRMAAARWGYDVANNAKKQGHILTAEEFTAMFEAKLPELVAP